MNRAFKAKYSGRCGSEACRLGGIAEGDVVVYTDDDELMHEACAAVDQTAPVDGRAACKACHLIHAGECF